MEYTKSLKNIKKNMVQQQDILKKIKRVHKHISHLSSTQILKYFNVTSILDIEEYIHIKIDIKDIEQSYEEDIFSCLCTDRYNNPKELYILQKDARDEAKRLYYQQGINLNIYPCRYSYGWHLTKNN